MREGCFSFAGWTCANTPLAEAWPSRQALKIPSGLGEVVREICWGISINQPRTLRCWLSVCRYLSETVAYQGDLRDLYCFFEDWAQLNVPAVPAKWKCEMSWIVLEYISLSNSQGRKKNFSKAQTCWWSQPLLRAVLWVCPGSNYLPGKAENDHSYCMAFVLNESVCPKAQDQE